MPIPKNTTAVIYYMYNDYNYYDGFAIENTTKRNTIRLLILQSTTLSLITKYCNSSNHLPRLLEP